MARSERDKFIDRLSALLRDLGVEIEDIASHRREALLRDLRHEQLNEHEAALGFAYGLLPELLQDDLEEARVLFHRLDVTADDWHDQDLVDRRRLAAREREARVALHRAGY